MLTKTKTNSRRVQAPKEPVVVQLPPTTAVRTDQILEVTIRQADYDVINYRRDLNEWAAQFTKDPAYAMEWSQKIFTAAARHKMAMTVLGWIWMYRKNGDEYSMPSSETIIRKIHRHLSDEVIRGARWPEHSSSPQSNEMSLQLNAARAEWLDKFEMAMGIGSWASCNNS